MNYTGFPELSQDDQLILIKIGFFEVWLGHISRLINSQEGTLTLADGVTLSKQQVDIIFEVSSPSFDVSNILSILSCPAFDVLQADFIQAIMSFAEGMNQMAMNDSEMALFSAAVLLSPDRPVISDIKGISQHQERITEALRLQVSSHDIGLLFDARITFLIGLVMDE